MEDMDEDTSSSSEESLNLKDERSLVEMDMEENDKEAVEANILKMNTFYKQIESNELDYDAHVGLIGVLRKLNKKEELRQAHKNMNKIYPLSPDIWLAWISDELKEIVPERREFMESLFEKSVSEYTSVKIWVEYIMFMLGGGDATKTRNICERALTAVGIHVAEGLLVWQTAILVEQQFYCNMQSTSTEKEQGEQKLRIQNLYRRQARVPLVNLEKKEFLTEASLWFDGEVDRSVKSDLEKSFKRMKEKLPYEEAILLAADEVEKLEAYRKYIDYVKENDNPAVIQSLYERAVTDLCLHSALWEEYIIFLMDQFPSCDSIVLPACERSQRNCPWSGALCELHISALEKFESVLEETVVEQKVKACVDKIISSGVRISEEIIKAWMAYLIYLRRKIVWSEKPSERLPIFRSACDEAITLIESKFNEEVDLECNIARFQARIEAQFAADMEAARILWNDHVMKRNNNFKNYSLWLEYLNLERCFGTEKHSRKLFRRALERVWENVEMIGVGFLHFEQECGTLETMTDFEKRYKDRLSVVQRRRLEQAAKDELEKKKEKSNSKLFKQGKQQPLTTNTSKQMKSKGTHHEDEDWKQTNKRETSASQVLKRPAEENEYRIAKKSKVESTSTHGEFVPHDPALDHRSVFLSNMDYKTEEKEVLPVFADCGEIENLRITKDFKGRSKGFGYLVFRDSASVFKALKLDRTPVGGRPLFISRCNPKNREHAFKFSPGLEKEKLFVKGLPFDMTEEDIKKVFEPHGNTKSVRLVTHRNGYSKGICYIEYHDSQTAEKVMKAIDGQVIKDLTISVKLSNPSAPKSSPSKLQLQTSNEQSFVTTRKPKVAFVPRAVLRKPPPKIGNGTSLSPKRSDSSEGSNVPSPKPKSNEDFRKMLLK